MSLDRNVLVLTDGTLASSDFTELDSRAIAFVRSVRKEFKDKLDVVMATVMDDAFVEHRDLHNSIRFKVSKIYTQTGFNPNDWKRLRYEEDQRLEGLANLMAIGRQPLFVGKVPTLFVHGEFKSEVALATTKSILGSKRTAEDRFEDLYYKRGTKRNDYISYKLPASLGGEKIGMFKVRTVEIDGVEFGLSKVLTITRGGRTEVLKHVKLIFEFPSL